MNNRLKFIIKDRYLENLKKIISDNDVDMKTIIFGIYVHCISVLNKNNEFYVYLKDGASKKNIKYEFNNEMTIHEWLLRNKDMIYAWQNEEMEDESEMISFLYNSEIDASAEKSSVICFAQLRNSEVEMELLFNNNQIYNNSSIKAFEKIYKRIINELSKNEANDFRDICLCEEDDKKKIYSFNDTDRPISDKRLIYKIIEDSAEKFSKRTAVFESGKKITYENLNKRANKIGRLLYEDFGIIAEDKVAVIVENCIERYISVLGIMKSGGAYIPVDITYPYEQIKYILQNSKAKVLIIKKEKLEMAQQLKSELKEIEKIICIDEYAECQIKEKEYICYKDEIDLKSDENLNVEIKENDLAYIVYTSGTTGNPKGVMIENRNIKNFCFWQIDKLNISKEDRITAYSNFSFDISVWEMLPTLMVGAAIYVVKESEKYNLDNLAEFINKNHITITYLPAFIVEKLLDYNIDSLRHMISEGDKLKYWKDKKYKIVNAYGPTETTVITTMEFIDRKYKNIPIGQPSYNQKILILDENEKLLPIGTIGEIYIAGDSVARGYINNKNETEKRFKKCPFFPDKNMYKTGDLGRYLDDGTLEFFGRIDTQVKIRGHRIELEEIEKVLEGNESIESCCVVLKQDNENKFLCALVVKNREIDDIKLKEFLKERLIRYKIPDIFISVKELPFSATGKVSRKEALKIVDSKFSIKAGNTEIQKQLINIWKEELEVDEVGINESLFALGGHSIIAVKILDKINNKYKIDVKLIDFLNNNSIEELSRVVESKIEKTKKRSNEKKQIISDEQNRFKPFPLTNIQRAYIVGRGDDFELGNCSTHDYEEYEFKDYNHKKLEYAVNKVIERQDALRIVITDKYQVVLEKVDYYKIKEYEIEDEEKLNDHLEKIRYEMKNEKLPIDKPPLFDIRVTRFKERAIMHCHFDCMMLDGWSQNLLLKEMLHYYINPNEELEEIKIQYRDYILHKMNNVDSEKYEEDKNYWIDKFKNTSFVPEITLKTDPLSIKNPEIKQFKTSITKEQWESIKDNAKSFEVTPFLVLVTIFSKVLERWTNNEKFFINIPNFNREFVDEQLKNVIGECSTFTYLEVDKSEEFNFIEEVKINQKRFWSNLAHNSLEGTEILKELWKSEGIIAPTIPIVFTSLLDMEEHADNIIYKTIAQSQTCQVWLDVIVSEYNDELHFNFDTVKGLIDENLIEDMVCAFKNIADELSQSKENWLKEYYDLIPQYQKDIIDKINTNFKELPDKTIQQLYEEAFDKYKDKIAVSSLNKRYTYGEFLEKGKNIARKLVSLNIQKNDKVAILIEKGVEQVASIFAVIMCGAVYVPISTEAPAERVKYCIENSESRIILSESSMRNKLDGLKNVEILYDDEKYEFSERKVSFAKTDMDDIMAIIYTSGTTGKPKGVMVPQRGILNCIYYTTEIMNADDNDKIISISSHNHDMSMYDILGTFCIGAEVIVLNSMNWKDPSHWIELINKYKVSIWISVPVTFEMLLNYIEGTEVKLPSLRNVFLGGEAMSEGLLGRIRKAAPNVQIYNIGGPTETTMWSNIYKIKDEEIHYGYPIANNQIYLLDNRENQVPFGVTGEIVNAGVGITNGYINNEDIGKNKYVFSKKFNKKMYRTGDIGRYLDNGCIEILGRKDSQIKINGKRIELEDIEKNILGYNGINRVIILQTKGKENKLAAFYMSDNEIDIRELKKWLGEKLPIYMIPKYIIRIDSIPTAATGKIDSNKLLNMIKFESKKDKSKISSEKTEGILKEIYSELLESDIVDMESTLFELGGDSLDSIKLLKSLNNRFKCNIPLSVILQDSSIKSIAAYIDELKKNSSEDLAENEIKKMSVSKCRLSNIQRNVFIEEKGSTDSRYSLLAYMDIEGNVDIDILKKSIQDISNEQIMLKAKIILEENMLYQIIDENLEIPIAYIEAEDIKSLYEEEEEIKNYVFDLESGSSLCRVKIVKYGYEKYRVIVAIHHIISDDQSFIIFFDEMIKNYKDYISGKQKKQEEKIDFLDYVLWKEKINSESRIQSEIDYWRENLNGNPEYLEIPYSQKADWRKFKSVTAQEKIENNYISLLQNLCRKADCTLYGGLSAVFFSFLYKLTKKNDLIFGTVLDNRNIKGTENMIGLFANTLPVRLNVDEEMNFNEVLKGTRNALNSVLNNQSLSFQTIVEKTGLRHELSRLPFHIIFNYLNKDKNDTVLDGVVFKAHEYYKDTSIYNLGVWIEKEDDEFNFVFEAREGYLNKENLSEFMKYFGEVLKECVSYPDKKLMDFGREEQNISEFFNFEMLG